MIVAFPHHIPNFVSAFHEPVSLLQDILQVCKLSHSGYHDLPAQQSIGIQTASCL